MRVARTTATASPESSSVTTSSSTRRASPSSIWPCHQQICVGGLLQEPEVTVAARGQALPQRAAARQLLHVLVRQPGEPVVRSPPPDAGGVLCDGGGGGACSYNLNFIFTAMVNLRAWSLSARLRLRHMHEHCHDLIFSESCACFSPCLSTVWASAPTVSFTLARSCFTSLISAAWRSPASTFLFSRSIASRRNTASCSRAARASSMVSACCR